MALPRPLAEFNKRVTNRFMIHIAGWAPGFAIVRHQGRRTGRRYQTPVNVFRRGNDFLFALTYGVDASWVKNVLAAGGCSIRASRRVVILTEPVLYADPRQTDIPIPARWVLRLIHVEHFLRMRAA
jgi:deazaflavin-dependent oxidoreductase (nitroreductase family)